MVMRTSNGTPLCTSNAANLSTFNYLSNTVRVVEIDGQPWFVGADVCKALGFHVKADGSVNVFNATYWLNDDEVSIAQISGMRGNPKLVSESGLY
jgi:prophage antirepressor-like protein